MSRSLMFEKDGERVLTVNAITGCLHECRYCYARKLAKTRLRGKPGYDPDFKPMFYKPALNRMIGKDKTVFISSMGDMFGYWVPIEWIKEVIRWCLSQNRSNTFYFLTKNPARYVELVDEYPTWFRQDNFVYGCTIEGDSLVVQMESEAPDPCYRQRAMARLEGVRKFLSIEPVMCFNKGTMVQWIEEIKPEFVYIGYDNHKNNLHEPSEEEVEELIIDLQGITEVRPKNLRGIKL